MTRSKPNSTQMTRDWLAQYTDIEIMIVQKIFENKTNFIIGHELELSPKSINIRILGIFKKMGIRTGLASKNLILYNFRTRHAEHLEKIKSFIMPPSITMEIPKAVIKRKAKEEDSARKIDFILNHGGYGIYDKQKIPYTREHLLCINFGFLNKIYNRTAKEVEKKELDNTNLKEMTADFPILPVGHDQFNGISYEPNFSTDKNRILLLFPMSKHKWISNDKSE